MTAEHPPASGGNKPLIAQATQAALPSRFGDFQVHAFEVTIDGQEYGAVVKGDVRGHIGIPKSFCPPPLRGVLLLISRDFKGFQAIPPIFA